MNQKAVVVTPVFGGGTTLDLSALTAALDDGWVVNQTSPSSNGAILVILEKPEQKSEN
jgi:hypothetical protein